MAERQPRGRPQPDEDEVGTPPMFPEVPRVTYELPKARTFATVFWESTDAMGKLKMELYAYERGHDPAPALGRLAKVQELLTELGEHLAHRKEGA